MCSRTAGGGHHPGQFFERLNVLSQQLVRIAEPNRWRAIFKRPFALSALSEVVADFHLSKHVATGGTFFRRRGGPGSDSGCQRIRVAKRAIRHESHISISSPSIDARRSGGLADAARGSAAVRAQVQQVDRPGKAKGIEDTAFNDYPLAS